MQLLAPHVKDLGGFTVRRLLPGPPLADQPRFVGPFVFFDHMGPATFEPGQGIDVRPHPHIGLATVTYLFAGAIMHRDSLGTVQRIEPGAVNWMAAGDGIVHSERTAPEDRDGRMTLHGIQTWLALPREHERGRPSFTHVRATDLPAFDHQGVHVRVIAGHFLGHHSPTPVMSPTLYAAIDAPSGSAFELPDEHDERALYVVHGDVRIDGQTVPARNLAVLAPGTTPGVTCDSDATLMLIGGAALDGERHVWWNFVATDRALIEDAKTRWRGQSMGHVPGETEFIPLPDR
ncbi:MAG TPA: pirin family protein [Burkholderiaceae bacterium]|nr:pirin family protein [Burkholderiaceae bacterium]